LKSFDQAQEIPGCGLPFYSDKNELHDMHDCLMSLVGYKSECVEKAVLQSKDSIVDLLVAIISIFNDKHLKESII
jgi:hypothetical protein